MNNETYENTARIIVLSQYPIVLVCVWLFTLKSYRIDTNMDPVYVDLVFVPEYMYVLLASRFFWSRYFFTMKQ